MIPPRRKVLAKTELEDSAAGSSWGQCSILNYRCVCNKIYYTTMQAPAGPVALSFTIIAMGQAGVAESLTLKFRPGR